MTASSPMLSPSSCSSPFPHLIHVQHFIPSHKPSLNPHPLAPNHTLTPQTPRPALTPNHSPYSPAPRCGTHPMLPTSYSHCQLLTGLRTLSPPAPPPTPLP